VTERPDLRRSRTQSEGREGDGGPIWCAAACRFGSSDKGQQGGVKLDAGLDHRGDSHRCTYHLPNYQALQESRFERPSHRRWLYRSGLINGWVRPIFDSAGFAAQTATSCYWWVIDPVPSSAWPYLAQDRSPHRSTR